MNEDHESYVPLLLAFDNAHPMPVTSASNIVWGVPCHPIATTLAKEAVERAHLEPADKLEGFTDSRKSFGRDMRLTDAGRLYAGLPPLVEVKTVKPKTERTLF